MPLRLLVVLPAAHLENVHFVAAALREHGGVDGGAVDKGRADLDGVALAEREDLRELHGRTDFGLEKLDLQFFAGTDPVLLAAGLDYCVHDDSFVADMIFTAPRARHP